MCVVSQTPAAEAEPGKNEEPLPDGGIIGLRGRALGRSDFRGSISRLSKSRLRV